MNKGAQGTHYQYVMAFSSSTATLNGLYYFLKYKLKLGSQIAFRSYIYTQCSLSSSLNVRQTVSLHLKRSDNCEKCETCYASKYFGIIVPNWDCIKSSLFK